MYRKPPETHKVEDEEDNQTEGPYGLRQGRAQNGIEEVLFVCMYAWHPSINLSNTVLMLASEPAIPTVVSPPAISLAAGSVSWETTLVWNSCGELL